MNEKTKRRATLDLARGVAIFLMILAHSVYFFHDYSNFVLKGLEKAGNSVCFVAFLLLSGTVSCIAYLQKEDEPKKRILRRLMVLVLGYYLLAFFVLIKDFSTASELSRLKLFVDVISFRNLPSYTEYIPPFIVFSALILLFRTELKKISQRLSLTLMVSALSYVFGSILYRISVPNSIVPWKAFFVGVDGFYRFPILQYLPIFLIGLYWGNILCDSEISEKEKKRFSLDASAIFITAIILFASIGNFSNIGYAELFRRWPPSISFLFVGLAFIFGLIYLIQKLNDFGKYPLLKDFFLVLGQNAFALFWTHIFVLSFYQMAGGAKVDSLFLFMVLFILVIVTSLALSTFIPFNFKWGLNLFRKSEELQIFENEPVVALGNEALLETKKEYSLLKKFFFPVDDKSLRKKRLIKKRHILGISLIVFFLSIGTISSVKEGIDTKIKSVQPVNWWNEKYAFAEQISIKNNESFLTIKQGQYLSFVFNHQEMVDKKKATLAGSDYKIVYWNGKKFFEDESYFEKISDKEGKITFKILDEINNNHEINNYYLYSGNPFSETLVKRTIPESWSYKYLTRFSKSLSHPYLATFGRQWYLRGIDKEITLSFDPENADILDAYYIIMPTKEKGPLNKMAGGKWQASINVSALKSGRYEVQIIASNNENEYKSNKTGFMLSDPIYVAWTQDWEGYDVSDQYLRAMSDISRKYSLPMTHFFNPRIYITDDISPVRADKLTSWIRERNIVNGEAIGMHLHMFHDLVSNAGVTVKNGPNWGDRGDGYGSLTTNYSETEIQKIIEYSLSLFNKNGLLKPTAYRCGGWFCNVETLKALQNTGFLVDSSGRTKYSFGSNNLPGNWDLLPTTLPYYPSNLNQNTSGTIQDTINILEIPNNGADSYWFSSTDMIARFKENYNTPILSEKKQVTFLTHPHWFNEKEQQKITDLFNYVDNYSYNNDSGPVVYATSNDIYKVFK